ncbi:MAG: hypothetical protein IJW22_03235, partial [Clostridia bacterium]|nr:hypothetical protein [Clostridia bacterium]
LDPTNYEGKHFITNVADKVPDTPVLVKVKNERSLNVALRLIEDMAEQVDLVRIDHEAEDFHMPHESDEALIEKGLIKIVLPSGVTLDELDETVKADILNLIGERKPKEEVPEAAEEEAEAAEEQPVAAAEAEVAVGDDALFGGVRYRRSYLSRYIQADAELQDYYTAIKNELLSYKKVVSRISCKQESFKRGREFLSIINVKGKSLYVYLAIDPAGYEGKHFITNVADKMPETPLLVKVKNERSLNVALRLIEEMAEQIDLVRIDHEAEDFHMPYESDEALIEKGLIKVITPDGVAPTGEKANIAELVAQKQESAETGEENAPAEADTTLAVAVADAPFDGVRYRRSYLSRYIQADTELQDYYTAIKNELLSYKKVVARTSWKQESFKRGREFLSIINVKGKCLYVYLAIDPAGYEGKHFITDASAKMPETPLLVKVKNERSLNVALRLIEEMAEQIDLVRIDHEAEDFHMPYESDEALIEKGLIKVIVPEGFDAAGEKANIGDLIAQKQEGAETGEETALAEDAVQADEQPEEQPELQLDEQLAALERGVIFAGDAPFDGVRYRRSYLSRYIQADTELQDAYTAIKNELLSYKKVVARTSWKQESFKRGRQFLSIINVKGKSLYVYLALDPAAYEGKHFVSAAEKMPETPVLVKVKNERSANVALHMITEMMEQQGIARIEREAEDFHMPYESDEALIEKGLIKVEMPENMSMEDAVKVDLSAYIAQRRDDLPAGMYITPEQAAANVIPDEVDEPAAVAEPEEPAQEAESPAEEPRAEQPAAQEEAPAATEAPATEDEQADAAAVSLFDGVRYRRSYLSRYIQADAELQDYYTAIKNELLSYKKVVARTSWKQESFKRGREFHSIINVKGKCLYVYLALDPAGYDGKHFITNAADKMPETPVLVKVKNERSLNVALRLIEEMAEQIDLVRTEHEAEDFHMPYESDEALLEKGLIKVMLPDGMSAEDAAKANVGGLIAESRTENRPATIVTLNIAPEQAAKNVVFKDHITDDDAGSPFAYSPQFIIGREPVAPAAEPVQVPYGQGTGSATYAYGPAGGDAPSRSMPFIDEDARALEQAAEQAAAAATEQQAAAEAPATEVAEPVAEEQAPVAEEATPETPTEEVAPTEEAEAAADATAAAESADDEPDNTDEQPDDVPQSYEVIDLTDLDFRDADLVQEIDVSMVDNFTYTLEAVKVSEKAYIGRTAYQIKLAPMSAATKRSYRVRKKNLVFNGDEPRPGVRMPYTREEFAALSRKQRKDAMVDAKAVLEYNRTCAKIALIQIAKTVDVKLVEKLKSLEEQLEAQRANLPVLQRWTECIKDK